MPRAHVLQKPMTRQQREDVADAMARALAKSLGKDDLLFTVTTVDARYEPIPGTGLDLVVRAPTPDCALVMWERHANAVGGEGRHRVSVTYTPPEVDGERQPERETIKMVDLDMLLLMDALEGFDDEDEALGLPVYRG